MGLCAFSASKREGGEKLIFYFIYGYCSFIARFGS